MFKKNLQTKIIFIFFILVAVIVISTNIFSYIKLEQVYLYSLDGEYQNAYTGFKSSITGNKDEDYLNFIKYFAVNNSERYGYLFDSENNLIGNMGINQNEIINKKDEIDNNEIIKDKNEYRYKNEIRDSEGKVVYHIYIMQTKSFINKQLNEYKMIIYIFITILLAITFIIAAAISRDIVNPINKLTRNLDDIINGNINDLEDIEIINTKNEIYDLVDKFKKLTIRLNENIKEISSQKAQIETILLHMSDGVMAFDIYGKLIYENPAAMKLLKIDKELKTFSEIFSSINVDVNLEKIIYLQDLTSSEQKINIEDTYINIYFESFKNEENDIDGVIVLLQNITEQVKLDNMRKEFVANVSHELKTPITSINSYSEALIENDLDNETRSKFLHVISIESKRMARLVSDLLQLSKFDLTKTKNIKVEFDLGELTKKAYEKISIEAEKRGQEVECYVTANVPRIVADKDGIEQVILNILSNAIKYTPDYGKIKIYVGFVYNHAYIKVIDTGIGIPKNDLNRVFERFYRVDKARSREQGGTGLGLAIAKEIVERNNGNIDINSEVGKGTEVIIKLPVKIEKEDKENI